jgi:FkbM family methyltransferase
MMAASDEEWRSFLCLAEGCSNLIDLGASGGFFSALFAATRPALARILSVEFDRTSLPILEETRSLNSAPQVEWAIDPRGVGERAGWLSVVSSGYGAATADEWSRASASYAAASNEAPVEEYEVEGDSLAGICGSHRFVPELIKMDIEGSEYEVLLSSEEFLTRHRPRLHLELHLGLLRERSRDPSLILSYLERIGYTLLCAKQPLAALTEADHTNGTLTLDLITPRFASAGFGH